MLPMPGSKERLGTWAQICPVTGLRGGSRQEPASFPSTKARMGPGTVDHEGSERHSQDMVQCKALGQTVPEVEHLALACSVMS